MNVVNMSTLSRVKYIVIALPICVAGVVLILWLLPNRLAFRSELREGNMIVSRVESFKSKNGRLPDDLKQVGIDDENLKIFYRKEDDKRYIVWFGTTLGESVTYDSQFGKWE